MSEEHNVDTAAINPRTRTMYESSYSRFPLYLYEKNKTLLAPEFLAKMEECAIVGSNNPRAKLQEALKTPVPPLVFENFQPTEFFEWMLSLRISSSNDGTSLPTVHSLSSHRCALRNLFHKYGAKISPEAEVKLRAFFTGLKKRKTVVSSKTKDPLPFSLYKFLALNYLKHASASDYHFAHLLIVLEWNLMCSSGIATSISYSRMEWVEDSLAIALYANDQKSSRYLYANPLMPEICPLLALGIYWICCGFDSEGIEVFPGRSQHERFRKVSKRFREIPAVASEFERRGIAEKNIFSFSMKRGSEAFCSSCLLVGGRGSSTDGLHNVAVGRTVSGYHDPHVVGRTVSGLPTNQPEFSTLPPTFEPGIENTVKLAIECCFPASPPSIRLVAEYALASVVYHSDFLLKVLPQDHPLRSSPLFANTELLRDLKVHCAVPKNINSVTGVPPHVEIMAQLRELKEKISAMEDRLECLAANDNGQSLKDTILQVLESTGLTRLAASNNLNSNNDAAPITGPSDRQQHYHSWGGSDYQKLPEDFTFPTGGPDILWQHWLCGSSSKRYPPLRIIKPSDICCSKVRKRYSDVKFLNNLLQERAAELGIDISGSNISIHTAIQVYNQCKDAIALPLVSAKKRKRRVNQLAWNTYCSILHKKNPTEKTD